VFGKAATFGAPPKGVVVRPKASEDAETFGEAPRVSGRVPKDSS
jgi:hypothetical protein